VRYGFAKRRRGSFESSLFRKVTSYWKDRDFKKLAETVRELYLIECRVILQSLTNEVSSISLSNPFSVIMGLSWNIGKSAPINRVSRFANYLSVNFTEG
jgi:hypothetical protein